MTRCYHCGSAVLTEYFSDIYGSGVRSTCIGCANETEQVDAPYAFVSTSLARRISELEDQQRADAMMGECAKGHPRATYGILCFDRGRQYVRCRQCERDKWARSRERSREYRRRQREEVPA